MQMRHYGFSGEMTKLRTNKDALYLEMLEAIWSVTHIIAKPNATAERFKAQWRTI